MGLSAAQKMFTTRQGPVVKSGGKVFLIIPNESR